MHYEYLAIQYHGPICLNITEFQGILRKCTPKVAKIKEADVKIHKIAIKLSPLICKNEYTVIAIVNEIIRK